MHHPGRLIEIDNLSVDYWQRGQWVTVVDGLNMHVNAGETFGLVGESGCGKSTTANAMLGYRPPGCRYYGGSVWYSGQDILKMHGSELRRVVGREITLVPQNPTTALSPGMRVGKQVVETLLLNHFCSSAREAQERTLELFRLVSLPAPEKLFYKYPHQLSGGQQQRVLISMALVCEPSLVLLDEPTTGLDVTTQAQILDLLRDLQSRLGMGMVYVTHNLGVVAQICDRIGVMYAGRMVEIASRHTIFKQPRHPYTQGLIASVPKINSPSHRQTLLLKGLLRRDELPAGCPFAPRCEFSVERCYREPQELTSLESDHWVACSRVENVPLYEDRLGQESAPTNGVEHTDLMQTIALMEVKDLDAGYGTRRIPGSLRREPTYAVEDISFDIHPGETFALVGESGSGKTTISRALTGLMSSVSGRLTFDRRYDLTQKLDKRHSELLHNIQLIFQNPDASLNPRHRVSEIVGRPLAKFFNLHGDELRKRVEGLLEDVRLDASYYHRFPDELSGGERQRIAIARALAAQPRLLLCDEVLSALDVSVQASVLELLVDLQTRHDIAYLFISHDLAVVRSLADRVGVLYWGGLCEVGRVDEIFNPPYHPYTQLLLNAIPEADPDQVMPPARKDIGLLTGDQRPACPFAARCPYELGSLCDDTLPPWQSVSDTYMLRCHIPLDELRRLTAVPLGEVLESTVE
jgi:peptide/nickel transport system ATP-binding protein